jgi:Kdo2-lipid IVA lauroyltransferase/acyltransferase
LSPLFSNGGIFFMRLLGRLPLAWVRGLGWLLGWCLYGVARSRRRVVEINLRLCFPLWSDARRRQVVQQHFVYFAQAWLDRGWLWHGSPQTARSRLRLTGAVDALRGDHAVLIFAPHFVGLDAGWTALTQQMTQTSSQRFATIYSHQTNQQVDHWVLAGRQRFGKPRLLDRADGPKALVAALRNGEHLYLLPDMNYDPRDSIFAPFYGVPAATVTSLPRLAKLGRAKVVPVVTRMTATGYDVEVMPAWTDYPGADVEHDTRLMNQRLEHFVDAMPAQYYWVHKRFKDRPDGESPPY